jgi:heme/copper-type cytochrome/quinol oxidase subunit 3
MEARTNMVESMEGYEKPAVSSSVLAIIMVIIVEAMFFGGLISAFILAKSTRIPWPPAEQPRLPFSVTFTNMLILLVSGILMWLYIKNVHNKTWLKLSILSGSVFFFVQGYEWLRILIFGIETSNSLFSSYFYTLIALHGLHVLAGLIILIYILNRHNAAGENRKNHAITAGLFWFFVVALWPVLYSLIYVY